MSGGKVGLLQRSIEVILAGQSESGAYVASPNFKNYQFCWFRDGAFTAFAMDLVGEHGSSARFHAWAARTVTASASVARRAVEKIRRGEPLAGEDTLHTRYTLDGREAPESGWPNDQLDGFGTWLWALAEHQRMGEVALPNEWLYAAGVAADYLEARWSGPCYDCWEENPGRIHAYTLGAIYAGLTAHSRVAGAAHTDVRGAIRRTLSQNAVADGHFVKFPGSVEVDSSLVGLCTPYRVFGADEPLMLATVARIEADLRRGGGVHRYPSDSYYGGGEWVLLTAWLGWHYAEHGESEKAEELASWVEAQADEQGQLPEQVPLGLNDAGSLPQWRSRWGEIARPLLWSHANYIILRRALDEVGG